MRNFYYKTNFNLQCPVLDIQQANDYLQEDNMTKYLLDSLRYDNVSPEEIEKVEDIYWEMTSNDTGSIVLTTNDKLLTATLDKISEWVSGQCSDGLGEGFEQQPFASYDDPNGGYYDDDDNWEEPVYCMASFDWETNKYKFTQVARPSQKLQESKGLRILKSEEFIKESLNSQSNEFNEYSRNNLAFGMNKAMSGYYRLEMYEPTKHSNSKNSILLLDDPAFDDYYDEYTAKELFNTFIKENFNEHSLDVINKAIENGLFLPDLNSREPSKIVAECENYIVNNSF